MIQVFKITDYDSIRQFRKTVVNIDTENHLINRKSTIVNADVKKNESPRKANATTAEEQSQPNFS